MQNDKIQLQRTPHYQKKSFSISWQSDNGKIIVMLHYSDSNLIEGRSLHIVQANTVTQLDCTTKLNKSWGNTNNT